MLDLDGDRQQMGTGRHFRKPSVYKIDRITNPAGSEADKQACTARAPAGSRPDIVEREQVQPSGPQ